MVINHLCQGIGAVRTPSHGWDMTSTAPRQLVQSWSHEVLIKNTKNKTGIKRIKLIHGSHGGRMTGALFCFLGLWNCPMSPRFTSRFYG